MRHADVQTIIFDDFQVWEGLCPPDSEPFSQTLVTHTPEWSGMKQSKGASNLKARVLFQSASTGGGCGKLVVENTSGKECSMYEVDLNIRPSWGTLSQRQGKFIMHGAEVVDIDAQAGVVASSAHFVTRKNSASFMWLPLVFYWFSLLGASPSTSLFGCKEVCVS